MLITNANIITWGKPNQILPDHAILIENGRILDFGPDAVMRSTYPHASLFDARDQLVLPGSICAHTHFYGMYSRGLAIPGEEPPASFSEILQRLWWPLDQALDEEAVRLSALVCLADAIKHGTTMLIDHHASPNFLLGSLDAIAEEVTRSGLRAVLCYETTDRYGPEKTRESIEENVNFIRSSRHNPRIRGTFGLHAPLTLSTATLEACVAAAEGLETGFHIHVNESIDDGQAMMENGMGTAWPVDWLNKYGILGPKTIVAHSVHSDEYELGQLAETGTWVTHQPRSNMNNAVGVAGVEDMLEMGVKVCLGNDGFSNAMWEEWKATYLLHKIHNEDPRRMNGNTVVEMAIYNNAALANVFFPEAPIGIIEKGAFADLMFVDYHAPTPLTAGNLPWHILFGFRDSMVTTTIVHGEVLMQDRKLLMLDEAEIGAKARELAPKVWERYNNYCS